MAACPLAACQSLSRSASCPQRRDVQLTTALSIVPGKPGVDPVAGEEQAVDGPSRCRAGTGSPGASEKVACFSRIDRAADERAPRAPGIASRTSRGGQRDKLLGRAAPVSALAPLDTSDRCDALVPECDAACRTPTASSAPAGPTNTSSITAAVVPEVHRHDRHRAPSLRGRHVGASAERRSRAEQRAQAEPRAPPRSTRRRRCARRGSRRRATRGRRSDARERVDAHLAAARLDEGARRLRVHLVQRLGRQHERRGRLVVAEHLRQHAHERRRRRASPDAWLSAATASGSHSQVVSFSSAARATPATATPSPAASTVTPPVLRSSRRARRSGPASRSTDRRSRHGIASHLSTAPSRCSGEGSGGHFSTDRPPERVEVGDLERRLEPHVVDRIDAAKELERRAVAPEEHVLPVVHELAGHAIGERRRAPAQLRPRVEHEHARARARPAPTQHEPGEPGADDDDVWGATQSCGELTLEARSYDRL